jgi:hypothetical protein
MYGIFLFLCSDDGHIGFPAPERIVEDAKSPLNPSPHRNSMANIYGVIQ